MPQLFKFTFTVILSLMIISCDNPLENRVGELENELENQKIEQDNQNKLIESLLAQLIKQQTVIDSLIIKQLEYSDSLFYIQIRYIDSVNLEQIQILDSINSNLTNYINDLISNQNDIIQTIILSQPSTGNDYIRIDGIQICWGSLIANSNGKTGYFPVSFSEPPTILITQIRIQGIPGVTNVTGTSAKFYTYSSDGQNKINYTAIGKWK